MAGLFLAEQITCATNIEIVACQRETGAKRIQRLHDFQPFFRGLGKFAIAGQCQVAIRAELGPSNPSSKLVELR